MFSATFLPVNYFKEMISGDISDYAVYAHSPFDTSNKKSHSRQGCKQQIYKKKYKRIYKDS